jgi:hypothetical protein
MSPLEKARKLVTSYEFQTLLNGKNHDKLINLVAFFIQDSNIEIIDSIISGLERDLNNGKKIDTKALLELKMQMRIVKSFDQTGL